MGGMGGVGGTYVQKTADALRAELDKDAFVRHLKERAAIAESGAGVREMELQQVRDPVAPDAVAPDMFFCFFCSFICSSAPSAPSYVLQLLINVLSVTASYFSFRHLSLLYIFCQKFF